MSNQDTLLSEFTNITAIDEERAKFYLESSAWNLEVALASFYENDGNEAPNESINDPGSDVEEISDASLPALVTGKPKTQNKKFATVTNLNSSSSDEEGQAFYAGGSEHSGQQVLGPSKRNDFVSEMFRSVQEHGAEVVEPHTSVPKPAFEGTGYKLGQSSNDTEVVAGSARRMSHTDITLKLWRDGFSVNDSEMRPYSDPVNKEFLESIKKGEIPTELIREARGSEVHLNMEDHRHEEFLKIKPKLQPFSGKGHTLGSPTPSALSTTPPSEKDSRQSEVEAKASVDLDRDQPVTNVQIRLADGTRLLGEFNHTHTVGDIRRYITIARPQYNGRGFNLLTTFPSHELNDKQTLSEAGLLNAAIMQRML